jgi:hypothetical protein
VQQAIDHAVGAVTAAMRDGFEAVAEAARKEAAAGR